MRTKQDYVLNQRDGKYVPEKVGLKAIQRDGIDYDFTLVIDLDHKHIATASKDRTGLFMGNPEHASFVIDNGTGKRIKNWCNINSKGLKQQIMDVESIDALKSLYEANKPVSDNIRKLFAYQNKVLKTLIQKEEENSVASTGNNLFKNSENGKG
jgi:hypothetical protein